MSHAACTRLAAGPSASGQRWQRGVARHLPTDLLQTTAAKFRQRQQRHVQTSINTCRAQSNPGGVGFQGAPGRNGSVTFQGAAAQAGGAASTGGQWNVASMQQQLKALGLAGVLAYGLFNTLYYACAFLFIWVYVAKVPAGLGPAMAARRFLEVFALTWAGSQVTKAARAGAALLFAPLVDRGLVFLQTRLRLKSRQQAFLVVVGCCLAFALVLFCGVVVAWS